ncbi:hypothetical protein GCM10023144_08060 [Pigmentiphaga soli]|uniref:Uncharacterized protein n=1 Tax=Pigmentiphaga soli TaxID=1007095 RepID=A0ABP8GJL8_9BURK
MKTMKIATPRMAACIVLALSGIAAGQAVLAASADDRYREEIARCNSGRSNEDRATCRREAGAALEEARHGKMPSAANQDQYARNAVARCDALPQEDRSACVARIQGKGVTRGSVEGGGIYREYREVVPGTQGNR